MISVISLWLPILLSAVAVFMVSSVVHVLLTYHNSNFSILPEEEKFRDSVRPLKIPPGEYMFPFCGGPKESNTDEYQAKLSAGPVGMMTVMPNGPFSMGRNLALWFAYSLFVGAFAAYVATRTLGMGADYLSVMRIVGAVAFGVYALGHIQESIWYARKWSTTAKFVFDGLVFAAVTGGIFGWLWPAS